MDDDGRAVIEIEDEVFGAATNRYDVVTNDPSEDIFEPIVAEHAGEICQAEGADALSDDAADD